MLDSNQFSFLKWIALHIDKWLVFCCMDAHSYTHNWWHVAVCHLEQGGTNALDKVLAIYDAHVWDSNYQGDHQVLLQLHISSINAPHLDCRNDVMPSWQLVCQLLTSRKPCVVSLISVFIAQDCLNALGLLLRLDVRGHHSCVDARLTSMHDLLLDEVQWLPMHTMHNT